MLIGSYGKVTKKLAGSQAIRQFSGHALFGYRVNHGEGTFYTISPSRRHSTALLRLSRNPFFLLKAFTYQRELQKRFINVKVIVKALQNVWAYKTSSSYKVDRARGVNLFFPPPANLQNPMYRHLYMCWCESLHIIASCTKQEKVEQSKVSQSPVLLHGFIVVQSPEASTF